MDRAKTRLAARQTIVATLPGDEHAIYRLVQLHKLVQALEARAARGEPAGPMPSDPEHERTVKAIVAAARQWMAVRDKLESENRLEAVVSSLQQRGLIERDGGPWVLPRGNT